MTNIAKPNISHTQRPAFRTYKLAEPVSGDEGAVVGNGLMSFVGGMDPQAKQDVRNTYQYASLAADFAYQAQEQKAKEDSRETPPDGEFWYNFFNAVMSHLGWLYVKRDYQLNTSLSRMFSMDSAVLELLKSAIAAAALPGAAAAKLLTVAQGAVDVMKGNSEISTLFDRQANKAKRVNFAVCTSYQKEDGEIFLAVATTLFDVQLAVTDVLFANYESSDVKIHQGEATMTLNEPIYAFARAQIQEELGDNARTVVKRFPIR